MENPRAYEQLVKRVEELEKQIKERPNKDDVMRDLRKDLLNYDDKIRSQGDITLKRNFIIRNRKGMVPGQEHPMDNSVVMYFNEELPARFNHIFLGDNSVKGDFRNNCLASRVVYKEGAPDVFNNGAVQFMLIRKEDLKPDGTIKNEGIPQITIHPIEAYGLGLKDGEVVSLLGTGENGVAQIGYVDSTAKYMQFSKSGIFFIGLPTSDPGVAGAVWNDTGTLKISS